MTVVVNNASVPLVRALKEMAKLDGAFVSVEREDAQYPKSLVKSVLKADKEIEREHSTLKTYSSAEELFAEIGDNSH